MKELIYFDVLFLSALFISLLFLSWRFFFKYKGDFGYVALILFVLVIYIIHIFNDAIANFLFTPLCL